MNKLPDLRWSYNPEWTTYDPTTGEEIIVSVLAWRTGIGDRAYGNYAVGSPHAFDEPWAYEKTKEYLLSKAEMDLSEIMGDLP
jgi:hypothetical protein